MPIRQDVLLKFLDGILDKQDVYLKKPVESTIIGIEKTKDCLVFHPYFRWNEEYFIQSGKGNNVQRIMVKSHDYNEHDEEESAKTKEKMLKESKKLVEEKYGDKREYFLINTKYHYKDIHTDTEDKSVIIGVFDYYIYGQVEDE